MPTMRCRWPNSEKLSSGLFGSPCTGWFCHSTLAISVDLRLFFAVGEAVAEADASTRRAERLAELGRDVERVALVRCCR